MRKTIRWQVLDTLERADTRANDIAIEECTLTDDAVIAAACVELAAAMRGECAALTRFVGSANSMLDWRVEKDFETCGEYLRYTYSNAEGRGRFEFSYQGERLTVTANCAADSKARLMAMKAGYIRRF